MTNAWETYQTRRAKGLENRPAPAPSWGRGRRALASRSEMPPAGDGPDQPVAPRVRLPGIWQPECGPLTAHIIVSRTWCENSASDTSSVADLPPALRSDIARLGRVNRNGE